MPHKTDEGRAPTPIDSSLFGKRQTFPLTFYPLHRHDKKMLYRLSHSIGERISSTLEINAFLDSFRCSGNLKYAFTLENPIEIFLGGADEEASTHNGEYFEKGRHSAPQALFSRKNGLCHSPYETDRQRRTAALYSGGSRENYAPLEVS
jgi:hypothetical protein